MPIHKYAKVLVLAPAIGSALIGIFGLLLCGAILIAGRSHFGSLPLGHAGQHTASIGPVSGALPALTRPAAAKASYPAAGNIQPQTRVTSDLFRRSIGSNQLALLKNLAGRSPDDADGKKQVSNLVGLVAPYVPFHFSVDAPLPQVIDMFLLRRPRPIQIRAGRYAMITGRPDLIGRGQAFLWIDLREGSALGGIFFYPSNGEPTPTLTIFSSELDRKTVRMSQLPRAFSEDLSAWASTADVPPITARYFIGASGEKTVLKHDENFCSRSEGLSDPVLKGMCEEMNAQAAGVDVAAARFMEQTHNAPNATFRMIASAAPVEQAQTAHVELVGAARQPQYGISNDGRIRDSLTGVELTVPQGWIFGGDGPSSGGGQMVRLQSSSNILVNIWMKPWAAKPSQIPGLLKRAMNDKSSMRSGGWKIRPESVVQRMLTGVSGVCSIADYIQNGRQMVEYDFWMQSGTTHVLFFGVTELQYLPTLEADVETVASSAQIP